MPKAPPHREADEEPKPEKIPRPPNAWIIYRGDRLTEWKAGRSPNDPPVKQADISRLIALRWKEEDDPIKLEYEKRAAIAKAEHKKRYPDYKYNP
ncbi:high mobility group box domain-containing protein, partial [Ganoderma leucocontextum]